MIDKTSLDSITWRVLSTEISCMERLRHDHLVRLFEVVDRHQSLNLVMECAMAGDLQRRVDEGGPIEEGLRKFLFRQIVSAIDYMVIDYKRYLSSVQNKFCVQLYLS